MILFQTLPQRTLLLLLISSAETSSDNMPQCCWSLAVLLALGFTSGPCRAGPLHAQCKVEWYLYFSHVLSNDALIVTNVLNNTCYKKGRWQIKACKYLKFLRLIWLTLVGFSICLEISQHDSSLILKNRNQNNLTSFCHLDYNSDLINKIKNQSDISDLWTWKLCFC